MMIGRAPPARSWRVTSRPLSPGSIRSSTTRSGRCCCTTLSAAGPSAAVSTLKPSRSRYSSTTSTIVGSSSTTKIVSPLIGVVAPYIADPASFYVMIACGGKYSARNRAWSLVLVCITEHTKSLSGAQLMCDEPRCYEMLTLYGGCTLPSEDYHAAPRGYPAAKHVLGVSNERSFAEPALRARRGCGLRSR